VDLEHQRRTGRLGGYLSWSRTENWDERLAKMHRNSPGHVEWHARRLFGQDIDLTSMTRTQWRRAECARRAWFAEFSSKGLAAQKVKDGLQRKQNAAVKRADKRQKKAGS
jgi:hypothetical protein